jgi:pyruvate kinase
MARIALQTEKNINYVKIFRDSDFMIKNAVDAISHSTCGMAIDLNAKAIVACSLSGMTARMVSRFRGPTDILGMTTEEQTWRKLSLSWGVYPVKAQAQCGTERLFAHAVECARSIGMVQAGDHVVITGGMPLGVPGGTNTLKVHTVE